MKMPHDGGEARILRMSIQNFTCKNVFVFDRVVLVYIEIKDFFSKSINNQCSTLFINVATQQK